MPLARSAQFDESTSELWRVLLRTVTRLAGNARRMSAKAASAATKASARRIVCCVCFESGASADPPSPDVCGARSKSEGRRSRAPVARTVEADGAGADAVAAAPHNDLRAFCVEATHRIEHFLVGI